MNKYQWQIADNQPILSSHSQTPALHPIALKILANFAFSDEQINKYLQPNYQTDLHSPLLFKDMPKALDRIIKAKNYKQKIMIFGDYDADGVCASSILYKVLKHFDFEIEVYLPDREKEGYGLNKKAIEFANSIGCQLIITVDCGISNKTEVELANELGLDVIITDHHDVPEIVPPALAIIHPGWDKNYPFSGLCGGGVAFKLATAIVNDERFSVPQEEQDKILKWLLDLVAISTVADMVPLVDENRVLVYYGLQVLRKTKNLGLQKMLLLAQRDLSKMDETGIGFVIAPRINAAGRMDHANVAFELLTTDEVDVALKLSNQLEENNLNRQRLIETMTVEAFQYLGSSITAPVAVMIADGWPTGLVGLVASKLVEKYNRPALVITLQDEQAVGSGRSPADFNLIENLHKLNRFFNRYGGHPGAAGFTLEKDKVNDFVLAFEEAVKAGRGPSGVKPILKISTIVDGYQLQAETGLSLAEDLFKFSPFGMSNPEPVLAILGARIVSTRLVGNAGKHLQLQVMHDGQVIKAIAFGYGQYESQLQAGQFIDMAVKIGINEWNGNRELQCSVVDVKTL